MSFKNLKKRRGSGETLRKTVQKIKEDDTRQTDKRFWEPTADAAGNGSALIRFLPPKDGEDLPFVRYFYHAFQGPTGLWYFENSRTTLGREEKDPCSEYNSELWNTGIEANRKKASEQKRKLQYVANILVLKDPKNPANEGKVFLYKFGVKIYDMIKAVMQPEEDDLGETPDPVDPFCFWEGADFQLRFKKVKGYRNYDASKFSKPSALLGGDDERLEEVYQAQHPLAPIVDESAFKDYDVLKERLQKVLGVGLMVSTSVVEDSTDEDEDRSLSSSAEDIDDDDLPEDFGVLDSGGGDEYLVSDDELDDDTVAYLEDLAMKG